MITYDMMTKMVLEHHAVEIPGGWLAHLDVVGRDNTVKDEYAESFLRKTQVLEEWNRRSNAIGQHRETVIGDAFRNAGYAVTRNAILEHGSEKLQVDVLCERFSELTLDHIVLSR